MAAPVVDDGAVVAVVGTGTVVGDDAKVRSLGPPPPPQAANPATRIDATVNRDTIAARVMTRAHLGLAAER